MASSLGVVTPDAGVRAAPPGWANDKLVAGAMGLLTAWSEAEMTAGTVEEAELAGFHD